jgi:hypothetical protein
MFEPVNTLPNAALDISATLQMVNFLHFKQIPNAKAN